MFNESTGTISLKIGNDVFADRCWNLFLKFPLNSYIPHGIPGGGQVGEGDEVGAELLGGAELLLLLTSIALLL